MTGHTTKVDLDVYDRETDLYEALCMFLSCNKAVYQGLRRLEALDPKPDPWGPLFHCERMIEGIAQELAPALDQLVRMVDRARETGHSWSMLGLDAKDADLREVFGSHSENFVETRSIWIGT